MTLKIEYEMVGKELPFWGSKYHGAVEELSLVIAPMLQLKAWPSPGFEP